MNEDWIQVLVAWLPFLVLIAVLVLFGWKQGMRARGPSGASMIELYEQQVIEVRKTNALLERIAVALEKRAGAAGPP